MLPPRTTTPGPLGAGCSTPRRARRARAPWEHRSPSRSVFGFDPSVHALASCFFFKALTESWPTNGLQNWGRETLACVPFLSDHPTNCDNTQAWMESTKKDTFTIARVGGAASTRFTIQSVVSHSQLLASAGGARACLAVKVHARSASLLLPCLNAPRAEAGEPRVWREAPGIPQGLLQLTRAAVRVAASWRRGRLGVHPHVPV